MEVQCILDLKDMHAGPPPRQAIAETAVATLKDSRFKAELQKGLEDCMAQLHNARQGEKRKGESAAHPAQMH